MEKPATAGAREHEGSHLEILIADNHVGVRQAIAMYIDSQPDLRVVGQASDGAETIERTLEHRPDVLIADISMPNGSGLDAVSAILEEWSELRAIIYSMHTGIERVRAAMDAGALGYVSKEAPGAELLDAVRSVGRGMTFFHAPLDPVSIESSDDAPRARPDSSPGAHDEQLSPRERQVLVLVARGFTSKEIAKQLQITAGSIDTYRVRVSRKLGLKTRADVVDYALKSGLLS